MVDAIPSSKRPWPTCQPLPQPAVRADMLAKLARAYYRNVEPAKSLDTADQALFMAEKHRLLFTLGEAMVTRRPPC